MKDYFFEIVCVIAISKRTQWAIILGGVFFFGMLLIGSYMAENLHFSGSLKGLEKIFTQKILHQYDKAALFFLISFWGLAFKFYHRDKKRMRLF
ncbi:MAG: hypothetical protein V7682_05425 [Cycloclasticus sp.]